MASATIADRTETIKEQLEQNKTLLRRETRADCLQERSQWKLTAEVAFATRVKSLRTKTTPKSLE